MGKYDPLKTFLQASRTEEVALTFEEIENLLGSPLPASRQYPAWWSNNPSNNPMTRVWLDAGYRTERVNTESGKVVFRRVGEPGAVPPASAVGLIDRLQAVLAGTVRVAPGVNLAEPAGEDWDAEQS
jgi:hypothetical protein